MARKAFTTRLLWPLLMVLAGAASLGRHERVDYRRLHPVTEWQALATVPSSCLRRKCIEHLGSSFGSETVPNRHRNSRARFGLHYRRDSVPRWKAFQDVQRICPRAVSVSRVLRRLQRRRET